MAGAIEKEIRIVLTVKNLAKVKAEIQSLLPTALAKQAGNFNVVINEVNKTVERTGVVSRGSAKDVAGFGRSLYDIAKIATFSTAGLRGLSASLAKVFEIANVGSDLDRARNSFSAFIGNVEGYLPVLREMTRGAVDDLHLLRTANRAVTEGLAKNKLADVFKIATVASRKLGLSVEETIQTVTSAITRQDESALTTLGTILKTNAAFKTQLEIIGKMPGPIHGAMQIQARHALIMGTLNKHIAGFAGLTEDGKESLDKLKAAFSNFRAEGGRLLTNALQPIIQALAGGINAVTGFFRVLNENKDVLKVIVNLLGAVAAGYIGIKVAAKTSELAILGFNAALNISRGVINIFKLGLAGPLGLTALLVGAGASIFALVGGFEGLGKVFDKVSVGFRVIQHMLANLDTDSGVTKVLKKDKEALGSWFGVVKNIAQFTYMAKEGFKAFGEGILTGASAMLKAMGIAEDFRAVLTGAFSSEGPIRRENLEKLTRFAEKFGQSLGAIASALAIVAGLIVKVNTAMQEMTNNAAFRIVSNLFSSSGISTGSAPIAMVKGAYGLATGAFSGSSEVSSPQLAPQNQLQTSSDLAMSDSLRKLLMVTEETRDINQQMLQNENQQKNSYTVDKALNGGQPMWRDK